jgi:hypothetical protein
MRPQRTLSQLRPDLYHAKTTRHSLCLSQLHHLTNTDQAEAVHAVRPKVRAMLTAATAAVHRVRTPDVPTPANQPSQHLGTV